MLGIRSESSQINAQRAYDYLIYQVQDRDLIRLLMA